MNERAELNPYCVDMYCPHHRGCEISKKNDGCPYFVGCKPIPIEEDWRVVGPWETEEEALEDLATLPLVGFAHYEMEERK